MKRTIYLLALCSLFVTSCKKEGCTDRNARNFDLDAKKDCSCCEYEGRALLWYGKTTAEELIKDGAVSLTYYVDGQIVGSSAASTFWTGAPDCGQNASITITKDLGIAKNKSYSYSVKDQTGFEYWKGTLNFTANTCEAVELTW